ncbi:MAG: HEAT repeat domain-containing protein [Flavobacteriales bacterium]|nr:HEAT repeat domain-containing protein [Flavobacteriales bacterium]
MNKILWAFALATIVFGCKTGKVPNSNTNHTISLDTFTVNAVPQPKVYNASNTRIHDLLHTKLNVRFDWEKQYMHGQAWLELKPYFYSSSQLSLDAKGMDIHKVTLLVENTEKELSFTYDSLKLNITLDKAYTANEKYTLFIDYTAKPNELPEGGSMAISSDKGLYFINPKGEDPKKPRQIWTQGETEAASCWFPTIDSPNERCTQEIYITIEKEFKTLSNGMLVSSVDNKNGTRTDYWKMDLPHAPYLFMMAIGDYAVVKDTWKKNDGKPIDVHYYVEKEYEKDARAIFGNTPEMLSFYSNVLGVEYPWQKYHQVVVRDYVSGAMENTTVVIHGEFLQKTKREMIDGDNEDIVAHELFHHWFGDLVTCESWANLPLNESFATYGEYLWIEHKYGKDEADLHLQGDLSTYLQEAKEKQVNMVRFDYPDKEDMFDSHSYAKGGRILHMLRKYVGDKAFFASLKLYLERHKFKPVEMHELRLAFEEVTGEDLNWFFNQWFYSSGHPDIVIDYSYNETTRKQYVVIKQKQNFETTPLYKIPLQIDIYSNGKKDSVKVTLELAEQAFEFDCPTKPDLVNVDAQKMLLCTKQDNKKSVDEWSFQYHHAPMYLDRYEAIQKLSKNSDEISVKTMLDALNDTHWNIRKYAIQNIRRAAKVQPDLVKNKLVELAQNDSKSKVRAEAIDVLARLFPDADTKEMLTNVLKNDSSYKVISTALLSIEKKNADEAMKYAAGYENETSTTLLLTLCEIYSYNADERKNNFFLNVHSKINGYEKFAFTQHFTRYLKRQPENIVLLGLPIIKNVAMNENAWWMRLSGLQALLDLTTFFDNKLKVTKDELKETPANSEKAVALHKEIKASERIVTELKSVLKEIKEKEDNPTLLRFLEEY